MDGYIQNIVKTGLYIFRIKVLMAACVIYNLSIGVVDGLLWGMLVSLTGNSVSRNQIVRL